MTTDSTTEHVVHGIEQIDEDLFVLVLERNGLAFTPGDCVALHAEAGISRPYSIASGNQEDSLRFLIRKMEDGVVSPWLVSRKPGDLVTVSPPFGWFRPGQDLAGSPFVFIATGTGIAPFLSYSQSFPENPPTHILWGVRKEVHAVGFDSFGCKMQLAVSREKTEQHHLGRVTDLLKRLERVPDTHYYVCGLESMITEVSQQLEEQGVDLFNIHREVFFHE